MATFSPIRQIDVHQDTIKITRIELQSGNTTPIELVPAPGTNKIISIISVTSYIDYNGTGYTAGNSVFITFVNTSATADTFTSNNTAIEETFDRLAPYLDRADGNQPVNNAVYAQSNENAIGAGGELTIDIVYIIMDI